MTPHRFSQVIHHYLRRMTQAQRQTDMQAVLLAMPPNIRTLYLAFIERWHLRAQAPGFWQQNGAVVFDAMMADARQTLKGIEEDDSAVLCFYEGAVLRFACEAAEQPALRDLMGISGRGPWARAVGFQGISAILRWVHR
jgi:hypothetical protein